MKVNVIKWVNVLEGKGKNIEIRNTFIKFYLKLSKVNWEIPNDILKTFNSADIVKCESKNRIVFNVGGNKYRLVCGYFFGKNFVNLFVKFVGSHKEYNKLMFVK